MMAPVMTKDSENEDSSKCARLEVSFDLEILDFKYFLRNEIKTDSSADLEPRRKKKRQSRWVTTEKDPKSFIPGMPTIIPSNMSKEQEKAYLSKTPILFVNKNVLLCNRILFQHILFFF